MDSKVTFTPRASLSNTQDLSLQTVTFIAKLPCNSRTCGNKCENHFHMASNDFIWYKVQCKNLSRRSEEQKSGKNTITKYINWQVKLFHSSQASTPNIHGKHNKGKNVHVTTKIKEIEIQQGNIIKFDLFHYSR